jgi:tetratricopeptide (TPR) repeat protein
MNNNVSGIVTGSVIQANQVTGDVYVTHANAPTGPNSPGVPRQLPPRGRFVNRHRERAILGRWVLSESHPSRVIVITGPGGVGKTAVAVEAAHSLIDRFPDGQLYADLAAFSPTGPKSSIEVLEQFLRAMGIPPDQIPAGDDELTALYRSRTANQRLLVLLDNAGSATQVRPLITTSPDSTVIITSRARLSELAMDISPRQLALDCFEAEHAVELLHAVIGTPASDTDRDTDRDAARRVAAFCHRLPLALTVAAATIANRPTHSLATLAQSLASRTDFLGLAVGSVSIRGVIDVSYDALSNLARTVYRVMALHPSTEWSVDVAVAALDQPADHVDAAVQELTETNLLDETSAGRFRYHDLIRVHATRTAEETLPVQQRDHALRAMATLYRDKCLAADLVLRPTQRKYSPAYTAVQLRFDTKDQAMGWFRRDREAVLATLHLARERSWTDLVCSTVEPIWVLLLHDGHFRSIIDTQLAGAEAARRSGNRFNEALALTRASFGLRHLGLHDEARSQCTAALTLAHAHESRWDRQDVLWMKSAAAHARGMAAEAAGDLDAALRDYDYSIRVEQQRTDGEADATGYGLALRRRSTAWLHAQRGDYATAHQILHEAEATMREIMRTTADSSGYGRTLQLRGKIHALAGEWDRARITMTDAEQILSSCGAHRWLVELYDTMAHIDLALHDVDAAREHLTAAQKIALDDGHHDQADVYARRIAALPTQCTPHNSSPPTNTKPTID